MVNIISTKTLLKKIKKLSFCNLIVKDQDQKVYSIEELEDMLIKIKNMSMDINNLPNELVPYRSHIEHFLSTHNVIDTDQCCGSGCANCIMNSYEDNFDEYCAALKQLKEEINKV